MADEQYKQDIIDEDLYEEFDDEELYELVQAERLKALQRAAEEKKTGRSKRPFPKWAFWLIAIAMVLQVATLIPQTFSIPAIDFLVTSTKLSTQADIKAYKKAVVVVETTDSRGTGFAISADGTIITNHHVIDGEKSVTVAFPNEGLFAADVLDSYPEIDLAVLKVVDGKDLPYLELANQTAFQPDEKVYFIGNPLRFNGIANEGTIIDYTQLNSWPANKAVLMMDAPVYRGNSGSPVINMEGQVIGVVFATLDTKTYGKVGLFVPIDYYLEL